MARRRGKALTAIGILLGLLLSAACGKSSSGDDGRQQVTYLTSFGNFGRDAYVWAAIDRGYFAEVGVEVEVQAGAGGENLALLTGGAAEFAVADITTALTLAATTDGDPGFTILGAIHQHTITGLMVLAESGITAPTDLAGATIADAQGSVNVLLFDTYARLAGFDPSLVRWEYAPPPELPGLLASGAVDAIGQFAIGQPLVEAAADGRAAVPLPYSDYLADLYGVVLFTTSDLAAQDPDLAARFTTALLRGLEWALEQPTAAGEILAAYDPTADATVAAAELRLLAPFARPENPEEPIGVMEEARVAQSIAVLEEAGVLPPGVTPERIVDFDLAPTSTD